MEATHRQSGRTTQTAHLVLVLAVASLPACSPVASPPVVARPAPTPAATVAPSIAVPTARWVFEQPAKDARAELDVGDGATLFVGEAGRRWLVRGGKTDDAETLAPRPLVDVRESEGVYTFLDAGGGLSVATTPLGPLTRSAVGPGAPNALLRLGKRAPIAVTRDGTVHRLETPTSATWTAQKLAGLGGYERIIAVETDRSGTVLVLARPQRLYVSRDDGATFAPVALGTTGARDICRRKSAYSLQATVDASNA